MDTSDGEIKDDFSDISEEEYFENIATKIQKRKLELEVLNQLVAYDNYDAKENRYENHRNRPNIASNRSNSNFRKEKTRKYSEMRNNRSYRASSIYSSGYSLPKKRKQRKRRKYPPKIPSPVVSLSSSEESIQDIRDESEDEELLALRLKALTSKQEVKELRENEVNSDFNLDESSPINEPTPAPSPVENSQSTTNEEEQLRIAALKSAIIKKKDHFRRRKQLRKLENERPYSPTDNFEPLDVAMDLGSPLGSPFLCDMNEEVDMEISNSPVHVAIENNEDNRESCDMELVCSPQQPKSEDVLIEDSENEDELALRNMLLSSINDKRKQDEKEKSPENEQEIISEPQSPQSLIAKNLKLAVVRLKQQKQQVQQPITHKSGTKTIKMLLEEQKNKKINQLREVLNIEEESSKSLPEIADNDVIETVKDLEVLETQENILIEKITDDKSLQVTADNPIVDKELLPVEPTDSSFSTITDTKNIPLLPETKKLDKRLVTALENIIRPVTPLVITLGAESSEDEYDVQNKKSQKRVVHKVQKSSSDFEKDVEHFLKNIRTQQEKSEVTKPIGKSNTSPSLKTSPKTSAVKHLPLSSQVEYEKLVQKMKELQEAKEQKQKAGKLKRTKSSSSTTDKSNQASQNSVSSEANKKDAVVNAVEVPAEKVPEKKSSKIDDTLSKIPLLDEAARIRLIQKTENNYLNHSKNLLQSTESNIKLLDENSLDFKRRDKIELKIVEIEKTLAKYKNLLRVVNSRITKNTPKILQSQRDMIKLRNHQRQFGEICKKVGEKVRGESYRLPENESSTIQTNFLQISEKTEEIHKAINEQPYTSKQFKLLSEKVKEFVVSENIEDAATQNDNSHQKGNSGRAIVRSVSQLIASCDNEENVPENQDAGNVEVPEIHRHIKRVLECAEPVPVNKRVKHYESPLEFLKSSSIANRKSVNQIVCPYAMEGTCNDTECKYLHL